MGTLKIFNFANTTRWCLYQSPIAPSPLLLQPILDGRKCNAATATAHCETHTRRSVLLVNRAAPRHRAKVSHGHTAAAHMLRQCSNTFPKMFAHVVESPKTPVSSSPLIVFMLAAVTWDPEHDDRDFGANQTKTPNWISHWVWELTYIVGALVQAPVLRVVRVRKPLRAHEQEERPLKTNGNSQFSLSSVQVHGLSKRTRQKRMMFHF